MLWCKNSIVNLANFGIYYVALLNLINILNYKHEIRLTARIAQLLAPNVTCLSVRSPVRMF